MLMASFFSFSADYAFQYVTCSAKVAQYFTTTMQMQFKEVVFWSNLLVTSSTDQTCGLYENNAVQLNFWNESNIKQWEGIYVKFLVVDIC